MFKDSNENDSLTQSLEQDEMVKRVTRKCQKKGRKERKLTGKQITKDSTGIVHHSILGALGILQTCLHKK